MPGSNAHRFNLGFFKANVALKQTNDLIWVQRFTSLLCQILLNILDVVDLLVVGLVGLHVYIYFSNIYLYYADLTISSVVEKHPYVRVSSLPAALEAELRLPWTAPV